TLWQRIGEEEGAKKIVDDFLDAVLDDPKVNFQRNGKFAMKPAQIQDLKNKFIALISHYGGGPRKYEGKTMKEVHRSMEITHAEFDALLKNMKEDFEKNNVGAEDMLGMLQAVKQTRNDIVAGKKVAPADAPAKENPQGQGHPKTRQDLPENKTGKLADQS